MQPEQKPSLRQRHSLRASNAESRIRLFSANRAENLCYQFKQGQKLLPQFRKIVGLVVQVVKF